ncbi:hypothetical protein [Aurantibacter sp.]|uniref:hypothetical protein n=1 Tax=Aurantibacter sp. TaxID=2807103 RepID=UPI0035C7C18A
MRNTILAIGLGIVGLLFVVYINYAYYQVVVTFKEVNNFNPYQYNISISSKLGMLFFGLLALLYSLNSLSKNKTTAIIGSVLGLSVVFLAFLPVFRYFL